MEYRQVGNAHSRQTDVELTPLSASTRIRVSSDGSSQDDPAEVSEASGLLPGSGPTHLHSTSPILLWWTSLGPSGQQKCWGTAVLACLLLAGLPLLLVTTRERSDSDDYQIHNAPPAAANSDNYAVGSMDIPQYALQVARTATGTDPDQVHITHFGVGEILFSWVTGSGQVGPTVTSPPAGSVLSVVYYGLASGNYSAVAEGFSTTYTQEYPTLLSFASALIHHVWVTGLTPGATYFYIVGNMQFQAVSPEFSFKVLPAPTTANLPFTVGFMGDTRQTHNTSVTLSQATARNYDLFIHTGDFSFADDWQFTGNCGVGLDACTSAQTLICGPLRNALCPSTSYQPKWDSWTRLFSPLIATTPFLHTNGEHEVEMDQLSFTQKSYNARFPTPLKGQSFVHPQPNNNNAGLQKDNNMYYSTDIPGAHIVFLSSYIIGDTFTPTSAQYLWLAADLAAVNRTATPWLIAVFHAPWYTTTVAHFLENEAMRHAYEPLLYKHGVDLVFNGHVHSYMRSKPVYNNILDLCGAVHIAIGDSGSSTETSATYIDISPAAYCTAPYTRTFPAYQPQLAFPAGTTATGGYCYTSVPNWVAYREPSFGHGTFTIVDATTATWSWNRNQDNVATVSDNVTWTKVASCANKR